MKNLLSFQGLLVALLMAVAIPARSHAPLATYEAMVVMHIDGLDDAALAKLSAVIGAEKDVTMEYSCVWSGVVVLKFANTSVGERADVITLARRQLNAAGIEKGVEFLHVHAEERGPGKC